MPTPEVEGLQTEIVRLRKEGDQLRLELEAALDALEAVDSEVMLQGQLLELVDKGLEPRRRTGAIPSSR